MKIARFTVNLALVWASFRMIADVIGKTVYGLLDIILYMLQIALYALIVTTTGAALYWIWTEAGAPMPF